MQYLCRMKSWLLMIVIPFLLFSCIKKEEQKKVNRCFYYWKTIFDLTAAEQDKLIDAGITKLYIRYFDVDWDKEKQVPVPVSHIRFGTQVNRALATVPTIFITNRTLQHLTDTSVAGLAVKITSMIKKLTKDTSAIKEVQLDCDWTESTAKRYFSLIDNVRKGLSSGTRVSATIRLHQVKYFEKTGVPPVDRGMLMFYNMGRLAESKTTNSIFDEQTARAYLMNFGRYPLKLDIALPLFSWGVVFRKDKVEYLMNDVTADDLEASPMFTKLEKYRFRANQSGYFRNYYLYRDDVVRVEEANQAGCMKAAQIISPYLENDNINVCIFHLDKNKPFFNDKKAQEAIYSVFN
jgi:hypothetical protein